MHRKSGTFRDISIGTLLSLLASFFIVLQTPVLANATIDYTNDQCDLTTSSANVYTINDANELWEIAECSDPTLPLLFELSQDIDVVNSSAPTWSPIGWDTGCNNDGIRFTSTRKAFQNTLDGKGFSVRNLAIEVARPCPAGLIALASNATIRNLTVHGTVTNTYQENSDAFRGFSGAAGLIGAVENVVTLSNVTNQANIFSFFGHSGGLVGGTNPSPGHGYVNLRIDDSQNTGSVNYQHAACRSGAGFGGLVGVLSANTPKSVLTVTGSTNSGEVDASGCDGNMAGGVIGLSEAAVRIEGFVNAATISGLTFLGGLVGESRHSLSIFGAKNVAPIIADTSALDTNIGGLVGSHDGPTLVVSQSQNLGAVSGHEQVGGMVGIVDSSDTTFINSENLGTVSATADFAGGFIGVSQNAGTYIFDSVSNRGRISGVRGVGGIFGLLQEDSVELTSVTNIGTIFGTGHSCGGLVGLTAQTTEIIISRSSNVGEVTCVERAGGLVGYLQEEVILKVNQSTNQGAVSASSGDAGGLVGLANEDADGPYLTELEMLSSFNTGDVSGSSHSAGLIGNAKSRAYQITRSYSVGLISGGTTSGLVGSDMAAAGFSSIAESYVGESAGQSTFDDGLVTAASSTVLVSVYTFANSSLTQSVTVAELKVVSTYVDWNFDTVWGFGGCDLNNGYPVLRWANEGATLYDFSCGVMSSSSPVVVPGNTPGNTPASNPAPVSYQGPMLESHQVTVVVQEAVVIEGLRLESIAEASVGGKDAQINQLTSTSLAITIPDLEPGTFDLVVQGSHGVLTVSLKFKVIEPSNQVASSSAALPFGELLGFRWISKFEGNSRDLSERQISLVSSALEVFANASTIVCYGYTKDSAPNDWALAHATQRAASLCNEVKAVRDDVRVYVRVQLGVNRYAAMRATMQFWESKKPQ